MGKKKSPDDYYRIAKERGADQCWTGINNDVTYGSLSKGEESTEKRILSMWKGYKERYPEAHERHLLHLKSFMREVAMGIEGMRCDLGVERRPGLEDHPAESTVVHYWKTFTRTFYRADDPLGPKITLSVRRYIQTDLQKDFPMPKVKRPRRFGTLTHYGHLAAQQWGADWHIYSDSSVRVYDWAGLNAHVTSSSRIGEYFESTCRPGTERGLHFRDVQFVVFYNEESKPELGFQLIRDAKGMTDIPHKRPQHVIYEGITPAPLYQNGMLFHLAFLLAKDALQGCETVDELFEKRPYPGDNISIIPWKKGIEDEPFYPSAFSKGVERAGPISRRIRELGIRAGYAEPPRPHDFRAGSLLRVSKCHTEAERRKHAGQRDNDTYDTYYASTLAADGQGAYFTGSSRSDVLELFQDLTIRRNPFMLQALSAQARAEFEDSKEIKDLRGELHTIKHENANNQGSKKRRAELYHKRRRLEIEACRKLQEQQASTFAEATTERCYYRSYFDRVRYLMPERDRLAKNLFQSAQLRESLGRSALTDLIALCTQKREVQYRPGLEPDKCNCKRSQEDYDWKHIHDCYKKQQSVPTTFCFMCHQWIAGKDEWKGHCLSHLERSDTIPKFCDPLAHAGVLATPGLCPFCLGDEAMPPETRLHQFVYIPPWKKHLRRCVESRKIGARSGSSIQCSHPHCQRKAPFTSLQELLYHIEDSHGCRLSQSQHDLDGRKRKREEEEHHDFGSKRTRQDSPCSITTIPSSTPKCRFIEVTASSLGDRKRQREQDEHLEFGSKRTRQSSTCSITTISSSSSKFVAVAIAKVESPSQTCEDISATQNDSLPSTAVKELNPDQASKVALTEDGVQCQGGSVETEEPRRQVGGAPIDADDNQFYVECILGRKNQSGVLKYKVKWLGWPVSDSSWEPVWNIDPELVDAYEKARSKKTKGRPKKAR